MVELRILSERLDLARRVLDCRVVCRMSLWSIETEIAQEDALEMSDLAVLGKEDWS